MITGNTGAVQVFGSSSATTRFLTDAKNPSSAVYSKLKAVKSETASKSIVSDTIDRGYHEGSTYPPHVTYTKIGDDIVQLSSLGLRLANISKVSETLEPQHPPKVLKKKGITVRNLVKPLTGQSAFNSLISSRTKITPYVFQPIHECRLKLNNETTQAGLILDALSNPDISLSYDIDAPPWIVRVISLASRNIGREEIEKYVKYTPGDEVEILYGYLIAFELFDTSELVIDVHLMHSESPILTKDICDAICEYLGLSFRPKTRNYSSWTAKSASFRKPAELPLSAVEKRIDTDAINSHTYHKAYRVLKIYNLRINPQAKSIGSSDEQAKTHENLLVVAKASISIEFGLHITSFLPVVQSWVENELSEIINRVQKEHSDPSIEDFSTCLVPMRNIEIPGAINESINAYSYKNFSEVHKIALENLFKNGPIFLKIDRRIACKDQVGVSYFHNQEEYRLSICQGTNEGHNFTIHWAYHFLYQKIIQLYGYTLPALYANEIQRDAPTQGDLQRCIEQEKKLKMLNARETVLSKEVETRAAAIKELEDEMKLPTITIGERRRIAAEVSALNSLLAKDSNDLVYCRKQIEGIVKTTITGNLVIVIFSKHFKAFYTISYILCYIK